MVVVFSEDSFVDPNTINGRELRATVEAARMLGCRIYPIPLDFEVCETADNALAYLPAFEPTVLGIWAGYIPAVARYAAIFDAAIAKGVRLINTPLEYQTAMKFDKFYPLLGELTPDSVVISSIDDLSSVETRLEFPVFVKGASSQTRIRDGPPVSHTMAPSWRLLHAICWRVNAALAGKSSHAVSSGFAPSPPIGNHSRLAVNVARSSTEPKSWHMVSTGMNTAIPPRSPRRRKRP